MQRLYLVRHGQTQWNKEHRMQGRQDSPLTELGLAQAAEACEQLKGVKFNVAYCSPAFRAVRTAGIILQPHGIKAEVCEDFAEIALGQWEGASYHGEDEKTEIERDHFWHSPEKYNPNPHGGESFSQVRDRALAGIARVLKANTQEDNLIIVAHTVTIRSVVNHFLNRPLAEFWHDPVMPPCSVSILECKFGVDGLQADVISYAGTDCSAGCC